MSYLANQPILILKEGSSRNRGKDAQRGNISAARIVSEVVKTTLGPRGMDKMMVDSLGDVTITSDGATVLDELDVQHPAAKMLVEVAKTQRSEEHTSELQSLAYIVCRLLLEKKKNHVARL